MRRALDLTDLDAWERSAPYDELARLRRESPIAWFGEEPPNHGFWSVHRYADIVDASRDTVRFSSATGVSFEEPTPEDMAARRTIIDMDPPTHTKLRKVLAPSFTSRAVAVYEPFVRSLTTVTLEEALAADELEFVASVAREIPIRVLARIMGLPDAHLDAFVDLGDKLTANTDPEITDVVWGRDDTDEYRNFPFRSPYGKQLWDLGRQLVRDRLHQPTDDLLSTVLAAEIDGEHLSDVDLDNLFSILVIAGNETTRIALAQGVLAVFEDPERFDVGRTPNPHLSFGRGGPHMCLGAHLARLEVRVVLDELRRRVVRIELAGEPARTRTNFTNGLKRLPVRVTA